ncbi:TRAPP complex subunit Trs120 [Schizosaccharomyces japonicus yFS275]|uniref:TRAPP complex subunit Trs120 n=1 Tax=Schizosaccharomyces japonicus (strain yFS275 / FY16936) TaxID=402676 RepID=B6K6M2_SCHJY|nr:TRAPP complex subunit Trs120 [Schizosaccharomyces japonicus yFS275]EEB09176.1 TRAPP complex subunit Trs120 [Schizosaccharomyces japonicus yFS275]
MELDFFSYAAPSRVQALVLPFGKIRKNRFRHFYELLFRVRNIRLNDVPQGAKSQHFNPLNFPLGQVVYNFIVNLDDQQSLLEEFEFFRRVFVLVAFVDGREDVSAEFISSKLEEWQRRVPHALVVRCIVFDCEDKERRAALATVPEVVFGPVGSFSPATAVRSLLCDITAEMLDTFNDLEYAITARSVILSPITEVPHLKPLERHGSGSSTRSFSRRTSSTFTIQSSGDNSTRTNPTGSEHSKVRFKGRAENQLGQLYLLAGLLPAAMRHFTTAIDCAKLTRDYLWHGLSLEMFSVCLLLLAYLQADVSIPEGMQNLFSSTLTSRNSVKEMVHVDNLLGLLTEIRNMVNSLYIKSTKQPHDSIPGLCFAESVLRYAHLLAMVRIANGINTASLDHIVMQVPLEKQRPITAYVPSKAVIYQWILKVDESQPEQLSVRELCRIYGAMANLLGSIGFFRQRALLLRRLLVQLTPSLLSTRYLNASRRGVHPDIEALNSALRLYSSQSTHTEPILLEVCRVYGFFDEDGSILQPNKIGWNWSSLQYAVVRNLVEFCSALGDCSGLMILISLYFFATLNRSQSEEQRTLFTAFQNAYKLLQNANIACSVPYWDPFLVLDICYTSSDEDEQLVYQSLVESTTPTRPKGPFLYNPFERPLSKKIEPDNHIVIVDERVSLRVRLRNRLSVDIELQSISLSVDGAHAECPDVFTTLPAKSETLVTLSLLPKEVGNLQITGCRATVLGCREQLFHFYDLDYIREEQIVRLEKMSPDKELSARNEQTWWDVQDKEWPKNTIQLQVVDKQPQLLLRACPAASRPLSMAEYETKTIPITLENVSSVPANLVHVQFFDSSAQYYTNALASKTITADQFYELEQEETEMPSFKLLYVEEPLHVDPHESRTFHIQLRAKPSMEKARIVFTYGHRSSSDAEYYYKRQVTVTLDIKVCSRIVLQGIEVLPQSMLDYSSCLLVMYFFNHYFEQQHITVFDNATDTEHSIDVYANSNAVLCVSTPRISLTQEELTKDIPRLSNRQFVLSKGMKDSLDETIYVKQRFWLKQVLLRRLKVQWESIVDGSRKGIVHMRPLILSRNSIPNLLSPPLAVYFEAEDPLVFDPHMYVWKVPFRTFFTIRVRFVNHTEKPLRASYALKLCSVSLQDMESPTLVLNGPAQRTMPVLGPGKEVSFSHSLFATTSGLFRIQVYAEETPSSSSAFCHSAYLPEPVILSVECPTVSDDNTKLSSD